MDCLPNGGGSYRVITIFQKVAQEHQVPCFIDELSIDQIRRNWAAEPFEKESNVLPFCLV